MRVGLCGLIDKLLVLEHGTVPNRIGIGLPGTDGHCSSCGLPVGGLLSLACGEAEGAARWPKLSALTNTYASSEPGRDLEADCCSSARAAPQAYYCCNCTAENPSGRPAPTGPLE